MPIEKNILILIGSPSDKDILKNLQMDGINLDCKFASAHGTPKLVQKYSNDKPLDAVIAAAGLSNVLASDCLRYVDVTIPIIALPLSDMNTFGLASLLSSQETPTGYPILVAKMDDINSAIKIAKNLVSDNYDSIEVITNLEKDKEVERACATLEDFGVKYSICNLCECKGIRKERKLLLIISGLDDYSIGDLEIINRQLGENIAVASYATNILDYGNSSGFDQLFDALKNYISANKTFPNIATVGFSNGTNLALFGIKIMARKNAILKDRLIEYLFERGKRYYDENEGC